jgi:hypothetical protein
VTGTNDKQEKKEQRNKWVGLLNAGWMFHQQMVKETQPTILGDAGSDDHLFHKALSVAIMDAMNFIRQVEAMGWFDDSEDEEESDILSIPGPAG